MFNFNVTPDKIINIIIGLSAFIIAGSIHEFAHAFSSYILGDSTARDYGRMTLNPLAHIDIFGTIIFPIFAAFSSIPIIGWMKPVPTNPNNFFNPSKGQAISAFAGPYSNLLQALIGAILIKILIIIDSFIIFSGISSTIIDYVYKIFFAYFRINIFLMIFNLLPFPPLDGGWIIRHFLSDRNKERFDKIYPFGIFILYGMMFLGIIGILFIPGYFLIELFYKGFRLSYIYIFIFIGIFLIMLLPFYLFIREDITHFVKTRKSRFNLKQNRKKADSQIAKHENDNARLIDRGEEIYNKLQNGIDLDDNDRAFLNNLEKQVNNSKDSKTDNKCEEIDFEFNDAFCLKCENYPECLLRRLGQNVK